MADNHNVNSRITSIHKDVLIQMGLTTSEGGVISNNSQLVDNQGNFLYPSGYPQTMEEEITRPSDNTEYTAFDNVAANVAIKQKNTFTFTGTGGTATVTTGSLVHTATFDQDIQQTIINFESLITLDYAAAGLTVTRNLEDIIVEATVAGVPFTTTVIENVTLDLAGTVTPNTANVSLTPIEFTGMSIAANGGGFIMGVKIETNMTNFASKNFRLFLYDSQQTTLLSDNVAYVNKYADVRKLIGFVDVAMEPLLTGSDSIVGQASTMMQYNPDVYSIFAGLMSVDTVTPTSEGKITITLYVLEIA